MMFPVESKQIAFCSYDEKKAVLQLHYHTGRVVAYPGVGKADYQRALNATNCLDALLHATLRGAEQEQGIQLSSNTREEKTIVKSV